MSEYVELDLCFEYSAGGPPSLALEERRLTDWLNEKAGDGWRLIAVDSGYYYFERKVRKLRLAPDYSSLPARTPETQG